jgi:P-type Ca2+ transporter type 2C
VKSRKETGGIWKECSPAKGGTSPFKLFLKQFKDFLVIILIIAAVIAFLADQMADVYLIAAVIIFNAVMGFYRNIKQSKQ